MAKMNSAFKYMFDAAPASSLMTKGAAAQIATFTSSPIVLDVLTGYWNPAPAAPADLTLAVVINVLALKASARTATITFATVIATDTFTLSDGVQSKTFIAGTDFAVGGTDTVTAANARDAINTAFAAHLISISATAALGVITLTNTLGTGGTITEAETTITPTAFAGNNETYKLDVEAGPTGFASSAVFGSLSITKPGQYVVLLDLDTVKAAKADATSIRIKGTLAGVDPSITAYSWIAGLHK